MSENAYRKSCDFNPFSTKQMNIDLQALPGKSKY